MAASDIISVLAFLVGGVLVSAFCNKLLLQFSHNLGIRNKNDVVIRWSNQSKPSLGGVSFFVVFVFSTMSYIMFIFFITLFLVMSTAGYLCLLV
jgi:UDP-GlcNAc:undecaprenyl-phosphate GlcNAc-1-phosphate transferase